MDASPAVEPTISVILPAMLGGGSVAAALPFWTGQNGSEAIEILVPCPDGADLSDTPPIRYLACPGALLHEARAIAVRASRGSHILLAEDHSVPQPGAIATLIARIEEGWDLVGPEMTAGTNRTRAAQAAFLLAYGQWMAPLVAGPTQDLAAHNVLVRASLLHDIGDGLEQELLMASFLIQRLSRTHRALLEPQWRQTHYDPPDLIRESEIYWIVGLGLGAVRTQSWPLWGRMAYPLLLPVAIGRHWLRGMIGYGHAGRRAGMSLGILPAMSLYAVLAGLGEAVGALRGPHAVTPQIWKCEIKPLTDAAIRLG